MICYSVVKPVQLTMVY